MRIQDNAVVAAVTLSNRYITERFLPDKAIDLVDEACAMIRTEIDSMPAELDAVTRRVMQLEIEEAALKKEKDSHSKSRLESLRKELADLKVQADGMQAQWQDEKEAISQVRQIREEIEETRRGIGAATRQYDLDRASQLQHGRLPALEKRLGEKESQLAAVPQGKRLLREEVTEEEVGRDCVALDRYTGDAAG